MTQFCKTWLSAIFAVFILAMGVAGALAQPVVNVATAPDARSVAIGTAATVFVEFVNSGDQTANNCAIAAPFGPPVNMSYQALDGTGALTGAANTPVSIAGGASQRFLLSVTPTAAFEGRIHFNYSCDNFTPFVFEDTNDLFLTASAGNPPDLIAIFATPSGDGILGVNASGGIEAAGGAVVNIGSSGAEASVEVTPTLGDFDPILGVALSICETVPASGACMAPPSPTVMMSVGPVAKTFSVFAIANPDIGAPLFPEYVRISVVFSDPAPAADAPQGGHGTGIAAINGTIRGRASVAYSAPAAAPEAGANPFAGAYLMRFRDLQNDPNSDFISVGELVIDGNNNAQGLYHRFNVLKSDGSLIGELDQVFTLQGVFDANALTFAGELVFQGDVLLGTETFRRNFNAVFDPGRSLRGTLMVAPGDDPVKTSGSTPGHRPKTIPKFSLNIQGSGFSSVRDKDCEIITSITTSKVFDVFQNNIKIGTMTVTKTNPNDISGRDYKLSGSFGKVSIAGNIRPELTYRTGPGGINRVFSRASVIDMDVKDAAGNAIFQGKKNLAADCTGNSLKYYANNIDDNKALNIEFRVP